jgi:hypothetical protein
MLNVTKVHFSGRSATAAPLYQYDYGQKLTFCGLDLPTTYEVHFAVEGASETVTVLGDDTGVLIPDEYLQTGKQIYAWLFLHEGENDGATEYKVTIPVLTRPEPSETQPTPVQQDVITQAIAALQAETGRAETAAENAETSADSAEASAQRAEEAAASIDEEMIAEAVADYLDDHPITVTEEDPTVPAWAKQPTKPTYTAAEVGAVSTAGLPDAIDTALAQAKASGEFDGAPGEDGYSPSATVSKSGKKSIITIRDKSGTTTAQVLDGIDGQDGYTPIKGVDYFDGVKGDPGNDGSDGITPTTTVTTITGGHNVAFRYGSGDARNTDFDVMDGADGHSPAVTASKTGKVTTVSVDGTAIATINDGEDGASGEATVETVSGANPVITGVANTRYICGEVSTISITPPASGIIDVIFTSGSSVAVLTVPNTVKWPSGFDPTSLETNTTYELNIMDGVYGAVMEWT